MRGFGAWRREALPQARRASANECVLKPRIERPAQANP
jgi:hypothetical protein